MTSQIMRADIDSDTFSGLFDDEPGRSIAYRKDTAIGLQTLFTDVFLESVPHLLGNEDDLFFLAAFRVSQDQLLFFHISRRQFQGFAHPDTSPRHEFQEDPVAGVGFLEDDLVDRFLFQDLPGSVLRGTEDLPDHWEVAGVFEARLAGIADKCEEGAEVGIPGSFCSLLCAVADFGKEGEDFLWRDRSQIPVAESGREPG